MNPSVRAALPETAERESLRRRVKRFYRRFNARAWDECFSQIDPQLTERGRVDQAVYTKQLGQFREIYGSITIWHTRLNLHLDVSANQRDKRPFAYVYVVWQDEAHAFHLFRERWVKENGRWFTRVVGLVPNRQGSSLDQE